jgi:hypothetical protein
VALGVPLGVLAGNIAMLPNGVYLCLYSE